MTSPSTTAPAVPRPARTPPPPPPAPPPPPPA
ncbi:energy transducer TonB, partial [Pseudomonas aeruginosa]